METVVSLTLCCHGDQRLAATWSCKPLIAGNAAPAEPALRTGHHEHCLPSMSSHGRTPTGGGVGGGGVGSPDSDMGCGDVVAVWEVELSDGVYRVQFCHGTTTGRRIVYINGKEVIRRDWMFKLVGKETFAVGAADTKATIHIEAVSGFSYEYSLEVDGKSLQKFTDNRARTTKTWLLKVEQEDYRVVLEKDTMDVWCNGQKMDTTGEFVEDGTETAFSLGKHECRIKAVGSAEKKTKRRSSIVHFLLLDGEKVPDSSQ